VSKTATALIVLVLAASSGLCFAGEWPKWLGPKGDGISTDPIADKWPTEGPKQVWEQKVGLGYSSPIALDGKVYLFSMQGKNDVLTAFDAETGKIAWSQGNIITVPGDPNGSQDEDPETHLPLPLATPTIDHGHIYSYGGGGDLICRKLEDGALVWQLNILKETHEKILQWAQASSPLVTEKLVYVQGGQGGPTAVAVDRETGKTVWQSEANTTGGYTAPIMVDVQGTPQLIIFAGTQLYGMNPQTGKTIWALPWQTSYDVNAATPNYRDGHLFISSDYGHGCMMVSLTPTGAKKEWENKEIQLKYQPAILDKDALYANSAGILKCMHWPDGKILWEARDRKMHLEQGGSIVRDGDLLITMSEVGKLSLVRATPKDYKLLGQVQLFDFRTTWSMPLIYRGKLYAMGKDHLVCLNIGSSTARGHAVAGDGVASGN
jgi:outer membrane protein assembly factor BamB